MDGGGGGAGGEPRLTAGGGERRTARPWGGAGGRRARGAAAPAGRGWRGRGREPEEGSLLPSAAAAVVLVGEPEGSSRRVSGMINHVWQRRGRRTRCTSPTPARRWLLTAVSAVLKSSPRGGQAEGVRVSPEPRDGSIPTLSLGSFETQET